MNEPNHLENLLASWTSRRPSAKLRASLFGEEVAARQTGNPSVSWDWLAPAALCVFTMLIVFGARPHGEMHFGKADTNLFFASITMNSVTSLNSASLLKTAFDLSKADMNLEQNVWRTATFASTNLGQTHSSMDSLPSGKTNRLMR